VVSPAREVSEGTSTKTVELRCKCVSNAHKSAPVSVYGCSRANPRMVQITGKEGSKKPKIGLGKIWERTPNSKNRFKSHRINGPHVLLRAHNPKVVSSNLTPATNSQLILNGLEAPLPSRFRFYVHLRPKFPKLLLRAVLRLSANLRLRRACKSFA